MHWSGYNTQEEAISMKINKGGVTYKATVKVEWEE